MDKYEIRRLKLLALRDRDFAQSNIALASRIGKTRSYVARMLYPIDRDGRKRIGEDSVDAIESAFGWPRGWLSDAAALPPRDASDSRRINLAMWLTTSGLPNGINRIIWELVRGAPLGKTAARRFERSWGMQVGYLDQPIVEPLRPRTKRPDRNLPVVVTQAHHDGSLYGFCRNVRLDDDPMPVAFDDPELWCLGDAYLNGSAERREGMRLLSELPEGEVANVLRLLQSI